MQRASYRTCAIVGPEGGREIILVEWLINIIRYLFFALVSGSIIFDYLLFAMNGNSHLSQIIE